MKLPCSNALRTDDETMPISSDDTHCGTKCNATIQITSEGASATKCYKSITTEIDSNLISHGSLYCGIPLFTKGEAQLSQVLE